MQKLNFEVIALHSNSQLYPFFRSSGQFNLKDRLVFYSCVKTAFFNRHHLKTFSKCNRLLRLAVPGEQLSQNRFVAETIHWL